MDEAEKLILSDPGSKKLTRLVRRLRAYYTSPLRKSDYADDEAGLLPDDLRRGVLSQDGIYDLLGRFDELSG